MTTVVPNGSEKSCNTKRISPAKNWFFTYNNYDLCYIENMLVPRFQELCDKYVMQQECGKEGTPHIQGVITLKKKARPLELGLEKAIHWEKVRNVKESYEYCCKEDTRDGKVWTHNYYVPRPLKIITKLYAWQKELEDAIVNTEPDGRTLYWRWETTGNIGKSSFCKYMYVKHRAYVVKGGSCVNICNMIFNTDMEQCRCFIIDIPRRKKNNVSYTAIECILDGMITNTKYECGIKAFNPPHVIVFSNFPPDTDETVSMDRWDIKKIEPCLQQKVDILFST